MTRWTENLIANATDLLGAGRRRDALACLLTVLTAHPDEPEALRLAASLAYGHQRRDEPGGINADDLRDTRLDPVFCHCDAPGCTASWISAGQVPDGEVMETGPRRGRCTEGHGYFCWNHVTESGGCPLCGGSLDNAPRVPNGRPSMQTTRRNGTIVHAFVLREGSGGPIGPDAMGELLNAVAPDVVEDQAEISGRNIPGLGYDPQGLLLAFAAKESDDYLIGTYGLYTHVGRDGNGNRWALLKVVTAAPRCVDPDDPPTAWERGADVPAPSWLAPPVG